MTSLRKKHISHISYSPELSEQIWSRKTVASIATLVDYARCVDSKRASEVPVLDIGCGRGELLRAGSAEMGNLGSYEFGIRWSYSL